VWPGTRGTMMRLPLGGALFPSVKTLEYCGVGCRGLLGVGDVAVVEVGAGCTGDRACMGCISGQDGTPDGPVLAVGTGGGGLGVILLAASGVAMRF